MNCCISCKHMADPYESRSLTYLRCYRNVVMAVNPVDCESYPVNDSWNYCLDERWDYGPIWLLVNGRNCGSSGRFWEPKE